MQYNKLTTNAK